MPEQTTFHLILHTHWDREWYLPRAAFQARLVAATGNLLELLERDPDARFVLDGQTIILEDALAVRPDWRERVTGAVTQGHLEVGPWYVLGDELIPSGESLLRNLLQGGQDCTALGRRMAVLYSPDAFGHPAILPTLANEFGICAGVAWRGLGHPSGSERDLYCWHGADGAEMLLYHLPAHGYEIGAALAGSPEESRRHWGVIRRTLVDRAVTSHVAVFIGADHHAPPHDPRVLCDRIQALEPDHAVQLSTLQEYFDSVRADLDADRLKSAVPSAGGRRPERISGELRWSYGHTWTLQGVHATRARLKRRHGAAELLLHRHAEVLATLASWRTGEDQRGLLRVAWRTLLQCQFHDTLCGCCNDLVAREQETRIVSVSALSREIVRTSWQQLTQHDPDAAQEQPATVTPTLLVWNPVPRARGGIVTAQVTCFRRDVMVGPPSGRAPRTGPGFQSFALASVDGQVIPVQVLSVAPGTERIDAGRHYPDQDEVDRVLVAFDSPAIPALGAVGFTLCMASRTPVPQGLEVHDRRISNRYLEVHVGDDGQVDLIDRRSEQHYVDVVRLFDEEDLGDTYTPCVRNGGPMVWSARPIDRTVLASGPLVAAIETRFAMPSAGHGEVVGRMVLVVHADSPVLRIRLEIDNRASDHRLRLNFPIGAGTAATAGAAFGFEQRDPVDHETRTFPAEQPVSTAPAQRYVAVGSGDRGLALLCPGFFEYEWTAHHELRFTLLRSVGELSRGALPTRPGHAGWPMETPDAQEPGLHVIEFALAPLADGEADDVMVLEGLWENTFLAPQSTFVRDFTGTLPLLRELEVALEGEGLVFASLKPPESGPGAVLRCYNTQFAPVAGRWVLAGAVARAELLRADESTLGRIDLDDAHVVPFTAPARGIVTILVAPGRG
jgi:alpha-mannosidase